MLPGNVLVRLHLNLGGNMQTVRRLGPAASRVISLAISSVMIATMVLSAALLPGAKPALAATQVVSIQRVSVPSAEGNNWSVNPSISADGRYVAFESAASNLVPGDNNGGADVLLRDRETGEITIVSVASSGTQGNADSVGPSISADGRYVAFVSLAGNLVDSDNDVTLDVLVRDLETRETSLISLSTDNVKGNGQSWDPCISADGRYVAFHSIADNLVTGDTNLVSDAFVRDRTTGRTTRLSLSSDNVEGNGGSELCSISADGRYVAFESEASNLVPSDNNGCRDVFVRDLETDQTTRVSVASGGAQGNGGSGGASISADGRYVAFLSLASNLVAGDNNLVEDIFVHDRQMGETTRISLSSGGAESDGVSFENSISADGRYVAFESGATNLVAGDNNGLPDVFVHDRQTGETTRVSLSSGGTEVDGESYSPSVSADGRCVAFHTLGTGYADVFVHDRQTEETTRVSLGWDGAEGNGGSWSDSGVISADGRYVAFESNASNLVSSDNNGVKDIFVRDRQTGETTRVSLASDNAQADGASGVPSISADGRYVAFYSSATNLVAGDTNSASDVFVRDRQTGETTRVSVDSSGNQGNATSYSANISADGMCVAFLSYASNLVVGDTNDECDIFVHDRQSGQTSRVSVDSGGTQANLYSYDPSISADGQYVAFQSYASNLVAGDTNGAADIFVRDRDAGATTRVSIDSSGTQGNDQSLFPSISADGRYVAFESYASNLVAQDTNNLYDVFVHDCQTGQTSRVSVTSGGTEGNQESHYPGISADGQYVAFESYASNLVAQDTNNLYDVFVHDRQTGETTRVSLSSDGTQGNGHSSSACVSAGGQCVAFHSAASNMVADDANGFVDVFVVSWQNPELAYDPTSIDFGLQDQDSTANQTLRVWNSGTGALSYSLSENSTWCSVMPDVGDSVGETDNVTVAIDTSGLSPGNYSTVILIASDGGLGIVPVHVSVQARPVIEVAPASHDFGTVAIGGTLEQVITVSNSGAGDLVIENVAAANPLAAPFSIVSDNCSGQTILPGDNCTLTVRFSPIVKGNFSDSFDIPSSDPDTPSVTVMLTGATPNTPPEAPVVDVTPDSPTSANDLVCNITTQSSDAHGDTITYTYQWYKDSVLQSSLTTNTVAAANTAKGQVWKCVVTPNDGTVDGPAAEDQVTIQNTAPATPVVDVTPNSPTTAADLVCSITTQSTDADGDTITYTYQWYKDDVLQSSLTTNTVPAASTARGQVWKCIVTPGDGTANGSPAEDQVTIQNTAPTAPVVAITPDSPGSSADLVCGITTESADADGDAITYTYQWYKGGEVQSALSTNTVPAANTAKGEMWKCVVTPSDSAASGPSAEDEVTVTGSAGGFPAGAIAGIVIGVLLVAGAAAFFWFRHSKKPQ